MRLTAETDRDAMAAHVEGLDQRGALRRSEARAGRLQRNARIRTGRWNLVIQIEEDHPPATMQTAGEGPLLNLSADPLPQPVTGYAAREWDLLVQKVWVMHEIGHLKHTDFADLESRLKSIPEGWQPVARQLWNAFEDGAVEATIRNRWPNYGHWTAQVRANLVEAVGPGIQDPDGGVVYPLVHATVLGILDRLAFDSGGFDRLLDPTDDRHHFHTDSDRERFEAEILPALEDAVRAVGSMPKGTDRNERAFEFIETVRPVIEDAVADGRGQVAAMAGDAWGMPDDAGHIGVESDAERVDELAHLSLGGEEQEPSGRDHPAETDPEVLTVPDRESIQDPGEDLESALAEEVADQQRTDTSQRDAQLENLEDLQRAVEAAATELETEGLVLPADSPEYDEGTATAAQEDGDRLAQVLRNRFQKRRKRSIKRNRRRGRLDPSALHRHATGETRLKQRRERPNEVEYHCLFVLDRSGSMQDHIRVAERAMGMLVFGLEAVDVEVSVLELLDKEVRLAKPADRDADSALPRLFHGSATGGTPLTDTLHIARERLKRARGKRFLFVVTDGRPSDPGRYREALNRFPVPVIGVNLTTENAAGASEFHREVTVEPTVEDLRGALRQLVQEVLFE